MLEGLILASSLTSSKCFGRQFSEFTELFKGKDQQLAWSGIERGGSKHINRELCGRNLIGLKIQTRSLRQRIEGTAKPKSSVPK